MEKGNGVDFGGGAGWRDFWRGASNIDIVHISVAAQLDTAAAVNRLTCSGFLPPLPEEQKKYCGSVIAVLCKNADKASCSRPGDTSAGEETLPLAWCMQQLGCGLQCRVWIRLHINGTSTRHDWRVLGK